MKKPGVFLRASIGIIILYLLIYKIDFNEVSKAISSLGIIVVFLFMLKYLFEKIMGAVNVKILFNALGDKISFLKLFMYSLVSYSLGLFSPGRIGEFSLIPMLKKENIEYGNSALVFLLDKFITILSLCLFSIYGFLLFLPINNALAIFILLLLVIFASGFFLFSKSIRRLVKKHILGKYSNKFKGFSKSLDVLLKEKRGALLANLALTFVQIIGGSFIFKIVFLHAGINMNIFIIAAISSAGRIISMIPISLSGLGVRESASVYFYSLLGVSSSIVGGTYLISLFVYYVIAGIFVLFLLQVLFPKEYKNLKTIK